VTGEKGNGLIRKYGLNMSRQAFREKAEDMGWKKVCIRADLLLSNSALTAGYAVPINDKDSMWHLDQSDYWACIDRTRELTTTR